MSSCFVEPGAWGDTCGRRLLVDVVSGGEASMTRLWPEDVMLFVICAGFVAVLIANLT